MRILLINALQEPIYHDLFNIRDCRALTLNDLEQSFYSVTTVKMTASYLFLTAFSLMHVVNFGILKSGIVSVEKRCRRHSVFGFVRP